MTSPYIRLVRGGKDIARCRREARVALRCQLYVDLACNSASHIVLNRKYALQFPFIGIGPEMAIRSPIDELRGDFHSRAIADNGTLENRVHAQLSSDFRDLLGRPPIRHD